MCGADDVDARARVPPAGAAQRQRRRLASALLRRVERRHAPRPLRRVVDERSGVPARARRAARPAADRGRVAAARTRSVGDEAVPADLRVDHVYLVSCKYLSRIVVNASPRAPVRPSAQGRARPARRRQLVRRDRAGRARRVVRDACATRVDARRCPMTSPRSTPSSGARSRTRSSAAARGRATATSATRRWSTRVAAGVGAAVARRDRHRTRSRCCGGCCASAARRTSCSARRRRASLRFRIATPWDWRQHFELRGVRRRSRAPAGNRWSTWNAVVRRRADGGPNVVVDGHVEIRWSHGRFCGPPEAKVYLDTPHAEVPGYFPLD